MFGKVWIVLMAFCGIGTQWEPGMLLYILQCTAKFTTTMNYLIQNVNTAEVEKPWSNLFNLPFYRRFPPPGLQTNDLDMAAKALY